MDMYVSDCFGIDDLLDFSNEELTTSSSSSSTDSHHHQPPLPPPQNPFLHHHNQSSSDTFNNFPSTDFTADLCVPNDDVAELEWLSQFVDNCFHNFPAKEMMLGSSTLRSDTPFHSKARSKLSRASTLEDLVAGKSKPKTEANGGSFSSSAEGSGVRRCTHCASEKTPQWRTGPLGPKTLCNACGVRYKSGRLVPEYRPASSPTFVLTQHSNSHRKVLELRRQKELVLMRLRQQEQQNKQHQQEQCYLHQHDFNDC